MKSTQLEACEQSDRQDVPFVLVCGCPRSGTYLLSSILGEVFKIAIPVESHFIPHFHRYINLWGDLGDKDNVRDLLKAMECFTAIWVRLGSRTKDPNTYATLSLFPDIRSISPDAADSFGVLLTRIFRRYSDRFGVSRYGDKSAPYEPEDLDAYAQAFPNLKVIHIVRDGRDVCLSWRKQWFGPKTVAETAWLWRQHLEMRRAWGQRHPNQYKLIHYEQLLERTNTTLSELSQFLRVPIEGVTSSTTQLAAALRKDGTHDKLTGPLDPLNVGKWRREMPTDDLRIFEQICANTLREFGYEPSQCGDQADDATALRAASTFLKRINSRYFYMRRVRSILPLAIYCLQRFGNSPVDGLIHRLTRDVLVPSTNESRASS